MANLPEPDWLTLFESAKRATRALGGAHTAIETALTAAFLDGKIRTRGRCRSDSGHDTLHPLGVPNRLAKIVGQLHSHLPALVFGIERQIGMTLQPLLEVP